jgi:hypothetical protein
MLAVLPFLSFCLIWIVFFFVYKDKKRALRMSIDITTFLLIGAVSGMIDATFASQFGGFWMILLFFLILAGLLGNAQNRLKGQINVKKLVRAVWRLGFVALGSLYVILLFAGIIKYIVTL